MEYIPDPMLGNELKDRLRQKYLTKREEVPHVSELIYCLTRSYFDRYDPVEPTDEEMVGFAIGFALEQVILRDDDTGTPPVEEVDGIYMSRDYVDLQGVGVDLKSTRMAPGPNGFPKRGFPDTWEEQFKAYAKIGLMPGDYNTPIPYKVAIIYLQPRVLEAGTCVFTRGEIEQEWEYLLKRKEIYMRYLVQQKIPTPFTYNKDWECRGCRYKLRCDSYNQEGGR